MMNLKELIEEIQQHPSNEKWALVKHLLRSLEQEQSVRNDQSDWQQFLRETYGSLRDTPIKRWDQGEYENREPLE